LNGKPYIAILSTSLHLRVVLWSKIAKHFEEYPGRLKVAKMLVELGLRIDPDGKIYCGPIEMDEAKIARALGVDRRTVKATAKSILEDDFLREIFSKLKPSGAFLRDVAKLLGYGVIEIYADSRMKGILAGAAQAIARRGISIRQAVADDPDLHPEPKLTIITEKPIPGDIIPELLRIEGVNKVVVY